jgi:hypothetical protein
MKVDRVSGTQRTAHPISVFVRFTMASIVVLPAVPEKRIPFGTLDDGAVFELDGIYHIKLYAGTISNLGFRVNCISLHSGVAAWFSDNCPITRKVKEVRLVPE